MIHRFVLSLVCLLILPTAIAAPSTDDVASWDFDVYLDDKKIGKHRFDIATIDGIREVNSVADFDYKFLFVSVYQYQHRAAERWTENCLLALDASTNANGDRVEVTGQRSANSFVIERDENRAKLPDCVMTFAYWNSDFLNERQLLNPQTGEFIDIQVDAVGDEMLEVRGTKVAAKRYRLTAYETDLTLWYSDNEEWLALESVAKGGRTIRYELSL